MKFLGFILAMKSCLVFAQNDIECDQYEEIKMSVFISGLSQTDSTIVFSDIANGFKLVPVDTTYRIVQFYVGYGCEYIEQLVKGHATGRQRWISKLKSDNIFSIHCILVQHGNKVFRAKSRIYFLKGYRPCD
jgi:hypothetical protein